MAKNNIVAGIYIHIPFCKQACHYCNFHFSTSLKHKDALINAILSEIDSRLHQWKHLKYDTIYFGGGTPSILPAKDIELILNKLYQNFDIDKHSEITLEGNPDDLNIDKIKAYQKIGINRLSIGIQSFIIEDLKKLNRSHTAQQAETVIKNAQDIGYYNITIDLIYGIPGLTNENWQNNIQKFIDFKIPHLSAYALTVEQKTALAWQIKQGKYPKVSDEQAAIQFDILREIMLQNGFDHYEISNFGKKGFWSRHNTNYWKNIPYLGLGPAAHSYNGTQRRWNIANNAKYIKGINNDNYYEIETLSKNDIFNELIMTGLRTMWGVNLDQIKALGDTYTDYLKKHSKTFLQNKQLVIENNHLKATTGSLFLIEGIISELFIV